MIAQLANNKNNSQKSKLIELILGTILFLIFKFDMLGFGMTPQASATAGVVLMMAFMLPVATSPNAIVFSSEKIRMSQMVRVGLILNIVIAMISAVFVYYFVLPAWGYGTSMPEWASR
jgi:di/tricarboxylate transporter